MAVTLDQLTDVWRTPDRPIEDYPIGDVPFWSELSAWAGVGTFEPRLGDLATAGRSRTSIALTRTRLWIHSLRNWAAGVSVDRHASVLAVCSAIVNGSKPV